MSTTVIGCDGSDLSAGALAALAAATLVVGGRRHLDTVPVPAGARTIALGPLAPALDALAGHAGDAVVLASGDPGFFGVLRALSERGLDEPPLVLPAVSSVAAAFARAGVSWDDALVVSAHGTGDGRELRRAANVCRAHPKVAVLTGPQAGVAELARELSGTGPARVERTLMVAQRLGGPDEAVERLTLDEAVQRTDWAQPNVVLCLDPRRARAAKSALAGWNGPAGAWALPESAFAHRDAQITKAETRAVVLARLAPKPGDLVWDLGAGSGSVGVECARLGAAVVAVEQDADSCGRITANAAAFGVEVAVVHGRAPAAFDGLPQPDAVFVGGGGLDVVRAALGYGPRRIVVALTAVERVGQVIALLDADGRKADGVLLQSSRLTALPGTAHRFAARNPVFVIWGDAE
jgi:precorrin-6Y C5,15-methyltransferase (decarboxylating)